MERNREYDKVYFKVNAAIIIEIILGVQMYHYTYLIQHNKKSFRYIGVRSSKVHPTQDTEYWGSSRHLPKNVKDTHSKIIIKIHPTRKEAIEHEIMLHNMNDVAKNPEYYNKAKQTSVGFDTSGVSIPKTEEWKQNCSITQKKLASMPGYKNPRKGVSLSKETKDKLSKTLKERGVNASINSNRFKPWFITRDGITYLYYHKTKAEVAIEENANTTSAYRNLATKSKGYRPIPSGKYKGWIVGNIEDAIKNMDKPIKKIRKKSWFITYSTYSDVFYTTSMKEYADSIGIKDQTIRDAVFLSKGQKVLKRGYFKGLILGAIS